MLPDIKLRVVTQFPAAVQPGVGLAMDKAAGVYKPRLAFETINTQASISPDKYATTLQLYWDSVANEYVTIPYTLPTAKVVSLSTTSATVATGSHSFAVDLGLGWAVGTRVKASDLDNLTNFMEGLVTAYNPLTGAVTIDADLISGGGTLSNWSIGIASEAGVSGPSSSGDELFAVFSGSSGKLIKDISIAIARNKLGSLDKAADFATTSFSSDIQFVEAGGYYATGDTPEKLLYARLSSTPSPVKLWHKQSADGAYWLLVTGLPTPLHMSGKGDGTTDDSAAVQAACDYPYANDVHFPLVSQNFKIVSQIELTSAHNGKRFTGRGQLKQPAAGQHIFNLTSVSDAIFDGLELRGYVPVSIGFAGGAASQNNAFTLTTCDNITIQNCKASRFGYRFVKDFGGKRIKVRHNYLFETCFATEFSGTRNFEIVGNVFENGAMFSNTPTAGQFCTVFSLDSVVSHPYGICIDGVINGNRVISAGYCQAILCHSGAHITIANNLLNGNTMGISVNPFDPGDTIADVAITGNTTVGIAGITMPSASDVGINVSAGGSTPDIVGVTVSGNIVEGHNRSSLDAGLGGILVANTNRATVGSNVVTGCGANGIVATSDDGLSITGNVISDVVTVGSTNNGVLFGSGSCAGTCVGNTTYNATIGFNYSITHSMVQANNRAVNATTAVSGTPGGTGV